jgi:hypothetical protein
MTETAKNSTEPELWIEVVQVGGHAHRTGGELQFTAAEPAKSATKVSDEMLAGVGETLKKVCQMVSGTLRAEDRPDELVIKFGLKVGAKGGMNIFLLTEVTGEATLAIEAKWAKPKPPKDTGT